MPALRSVLVSLAILLQASFLAVGSSSQDHPVVATNFAWTPKNLTIAPGDTVTFTSAEGTHNFVSDAGDGASCTLPCTRAYPTWGKHEFHCGVHPSMKGAISVGTPPSVSITSHAAGDAVSGIVTVSGTATHANETIARVEVRVEGVLVATVAPAADGTWSAAWDSTLTANGAATVAALALTAPTDLFAEASVSVDVDNPPKVDLRAISVFGGTGVANVSISYTVQNDGNVPVGPFTAQIEYHYKGTWRPLGAASLSLGAFERVTGRFLWDEPGEHLGRYSIRVVLDPLGFVAETDEGNNVATGAASWVTPNLNGVDPLDP